MRTWHKVAMIATLGGVIAAAQGTAMADAGHGQGQGHGRGGKPSLDLQAHRGGIGLTVESTLPAFARALELGVNTLELDIQITEDGQAVVTHDRQIDGRKCADTAPAVAGDPEYPYVGKFINTLSVKQIRTMDCGSRTLAEFPRQQAAPGARMPLLSEVFDLVKRYHANDVMMNIETKVEAGAPRETAPREQFVQVAAQEIRKAGMLRQVTIQSFDWGALMRMHEVEPRLPLVALTNPQYQGVPGTEVWLGGLDLDDFGGDPLKAIKSFGASAYSPTPGTPEAAGVTDPDYRPYVTKQLVDEAHSLGIKVIPWTADDAPTMNAMIDAGVDGIITNYPDVLREVMDERGYELPKPHRVKGHA
ncbi:glycerophosphodiester phosphodiesterase family protein [Nonomuraea jiangxiensis]|uniref:Glycerophosphoryl diester phosphodiesterase n=1 Tax=Nonomuraea jiangxiensis TaxID=633440 RepID=A0A1G7ZSC7_9ACTN|nr:glycerophosphodiester phosphodiesterase family protein [Nonomuraea jiangxiensis]SDH11593.1 glycerophosphoryl diester phosphodiesterase [Nonomuraea jiangxiensis]